jgi:hypothetical protein
MLCLSGVAEARSRPWLAKDTAERAVARVAAYEGPHYLGAGRYKIVRRKRWARTRVMCTVRYSGADFFDDGSTGTLWWRYVAVLRGRVVTVRAPS